MIDTLNTRHGLPGHLRFVAGPSALPLIEIDNPHARARIALHGGQVLSFWPHGAAHDLLFVSERAIYQTGKALRGGVPVCWPWFGPDPERLGRPNHGFARTRLWQVIDTEARPNGDTVVTLGLDDSADTLALWPHAFALRLTVCVGRSLSLSLSTRNTGATPLRLTQALHTYLTVQDSAQASVHGLEGCTYTDNARSGQGAQRQQTGPVRFQGEVERIYHPSPAQLSLNEGADTPTIELHSEGSASTVVWNPGTDIATTFADLQPGGEQRFVCIETANVAQDAITLPAGAEHRLGVCIQLRG